MASGQTSPPVLSPAPGVSAPSAHPPSRARVVLSAVGLIFLAGVVTVAAVLEMRASRAVLTGPQTSVAAPRPPLTRAEEAYIRALWPIHGDVERSTVRMSLGQIFYKTNDLSRKDLKARVDEALLTYRSAETRLRALQPPPSLQPAHADYLGAVRLFQQSALEVLKMFDDGSEEHLRVAYPLGLEGSNKIREVGAKFWPDEFPPN
jgi:hypothetical protein